MNTCRDRSRDCGRVGFDRALPNAYDVVASRLEPEGVSRVPRGDPADAFSPEVGIRGRRDVVLWAPVPEAAVNEDGNPRAGEEEVRAGAGHASSQPIAGAALPERLTQQHLGTGVLALHRLHRGAPLRRGEGVGPGSFHQIVH